MRKFLFVLLAGILFFQAPSWAATYAVDKDHTSVSFKIRHLFTKVQGTFRDFEGTISYDPDKPDSWGATGTIQTNSIDTNAEQRDKHLRSADFFDVEKYPLISFKTTKVLEKTPDGAKMQGLLTMHGVEKPITFDVKINGAGKDPWGNTRASFTVTTTINREDFGLKWNETLETGKLLVGQEVEILLEVEGLLKE